MIFVSKDPLLYIDILQVYYLTLSLVMLFNTLPSNVFFIRIIISDFLYLTPSFSDTLLYLDDKKLSSQVMKLFCIFYVVCALDLETEAGANGSQN